MTTPHATPGGALLRVLRVLCFAFAALSFAMGTWTIWIARTACPDRVRGCGPLVSAALFLFLPAGVVCTVAAVGLGWVARRHRRDPPPDASA